MREVGIVKRITNLADFYRTDEWEALIAVLAMEPERQNAAGTLPLASFCPSHNTAWTRLLCPWRLRRTQTAQGRL